MSEFYLLLVYLHLYHTLVSISKLCTSRHGYIFTLTNHSLEFALNFSIGYCIDQPFIRVSILGWSLLDPHAFVVKIVCLDFSSLFINNTHLHNCRENAICFGSYFREFLRVKLSFRFESLTLYQWEEITLS